ncbi:MAG: hypothetical protein FWG87_04120 [Defluviitaleaceae bacterium]|nr:hypothetical protein [Defluviitaleaceae bacterium]
MNKPPPNTTKPPTPRPRPPRQPHPVLDSLRDTPKPHTNPTPTPTPQQKRNESALKYANKPVRSKLSADTIKVLVITALAMVGFMVLMVFIANLEIPENTQKPEQDTANAEPIIDPPAAPNEWGTIPAEQLLDQVFYWYSPADGGMGGELELPAIGATGWVAAALSLRTTPSGNSTGNSLPSGTAFTILDEAPDWWLVQLPSGETGWAEIRRCFINLPDVLPSIIYVNTNASDENTTSGRHTYRQDRQRGGSLFTSGGQEMDIWGKQLYQAWAFNARLGHDEYNVPCMYSMALALFRVQRKALSEGKTLIVYEVFRPRSTQRAIVDSFNRHLDDNPYIRREIDESAFTVGNFISQGVSNHQRGAALDVSIGDVREMEYIQIGGFTLERITDYAELISWRMMHVLHPDSAYNNTREIDAVVYLRELFRTQGFSPISSEWWHFDHTASINTARSVGIDGEFNTAVNYSILPDM